MSLTQQQAEEIKEQLLEQVEKLNVSNKEQIKEHIENLDERGLEEFLKQNNIQISEKGLRQEQQSQQALESEKPIFELIVANQLPSYKIAENKQSIAVLEIAPLSKGHCLVIPKQKTSIEKIPKTAFSLAQKIAKKIKTKLKPLDIKIETFSLQDYPAINIIPIYNNRQLQKKKANEEELKNLQSLLSFEKKQITKPKTKKIKNLPEISFRIP